MHAFIGELENWSVLSCKLLISYEVACVPVVIDFKLLLPWLHMKLHSEINIFFRKYEHCFSIYSRVYMVQKPIYSLLISGFNGPFLKYSINSRILFTFTQVFYVKTIWFRF